MFNFDVRFLYLLLLLAYTISIIIFRFFFSVFAINFLLFFYRFSIINHRHTDTQTQKGKIVNILQWMNEEKEKKKLNFSQTILVLQELSCFCQSWAVFLFFFQVKLSFTLPITTATSNRQPAKVTPIQCNSILTMQYTMTDEMTDWLTEWLAGCMWLHVKLVIWLNASCRLLPGLPLFIFQYATRAFCNQSQSLTTTTYDNDILFIFRPDQLKMKGGGGVIRLRATFAFAFQYNKLHSARVLQS